MGVKKVASNWEERLLAPQRAVLDRACPGDIKTSHLEKLLFRREVPVTSRAVAWRSNISIWHFMAASKALLIHCATQPHQIA